VLFPFFISDCDCERHSFFLKPHPEFSHGIVYLQSTPSILLRVPWPKKVHTSIELRAEPPLFNTCSIINNDTVSPHPEETVPITYTLSTNLCKFTGTRTGFLPRPNHATLLVTIGTIFHRTFHLLRAALDTREQVREMRKRKMHSICAQRHSYLYINNEYYRVLRYVDDTIFDIATSTAPRCNSYYLTSFKTLVKPTSAGHEPKIRPDNLPVICFDCETMPFNEPDAHHQAYLLHAKFDLNSMYMENHVYEQSFEHLDYTSHESTVGDQFVNWINTFIFDSEEDRTAGKRAITLYGFNNNKFDNHFIIEAFKRAGYTVKQWARNGVVSESSMRSSRYKCSIYIKDLIKWLPDATLESACLDYNIIQAKSLCNIVEYNKLCAESTCILQTTPHETVFHRISGARTFPQKRDLKQRYYRAEYSSWMLFDFVRDYCVRDVAATHELYQTLNKVLLQFIDEFPSYTFPSSNIFGYISPAYFTSLVTYSQLHSAKQQQLYTVDAALTKHITSSYYGGMVKYGILGSFTGKIYSKDVRAMYPTMMMAPLPQITSTDSFLIGDQINYVQVQKIFDDAHVAYLRNYEERNIMRLEFLRAFNTECVGIFCVNTFPPPDPHMCTSWAPLPYHYAGADSLTYDFLPKCRAVYNTYDLRCLLALGFRIEIVRCASNIQFLEVGTVLADYITTLNTLKNAHRSNTAWKKLFKLLMNSIPGKFAQRSEHTLRYQHEETTYNQSNSYRETSGRSMHYIATFITGQARYSLFTYMLYLESYYINMHTPRIDRPCILLYCDTDSIFFTDDQCPADAIDLNVFTESEDLGVWCPERCRFELTWGAKHLGVNNMIILARKSYVLLVDDQIESRTLKGIHREYMGQFTREILHKIIRECAFNKPNDTSSRSGYQICARGLTRRARNEGTFLTSNYKKNISKLLVEDFIKKTLSLELEAHIYTTPCISIQNKLAVESGLLFYVHDYYSASSTMSSTASSGIHVGAPATATTSHTS